MKKLVKFAPAICSAGWLICLLLIVFLDAADYKTLSIIMSATLFITNLLWFVKENENDWKAEGLNDEPGRESEHNTDSAS